MPKSKRAKVVNLSKVGKKGKELSQKLFRNVRECLDQYAYCWAYSVEAMRNTYLKDVRNELSDSRLFFGKTKVMAKALGLTPEEAYQRNTEKLAVHLNGDMGLLFTNREPQSIIDYFENLAKTDFARAGTEATRDFSIPAGIVMSTGGQIAAEDDTPLAHSLEPELRKLGMPTSLEKGKIILQNDYTVCREHDTLDSRQTRLMKLFNLATADFRVSLKAHWKSSTSEVTVMDAMND
ncbi:Bgt-2304 [Blumeria graminis f. sp. tritici]|uniref:Ribosome assembly factor mrt4 n=3 Tax=Blumeria graminis TaxID=34373 RepID=A0A061HLD2_BLUGR|nr:hypothetical protein BGT96224_2304 [Blumeria graminis f. sp. tritici 96224]VDB94550.1 Bgt-2304 [Blumeria graminis f. sp. tritici]